MVQITDWIREKLGLTPVAEDDVNEPLVNDAPFLDEILAEQLVSVLERFESSVGVVAVIDKKTSFGAEIHKFLQEFEALTDKVFVEYLSAGENPVREQELGVVVSPSIVLIDENGQSRGVQFHSVPAGHELDSFVLALYNAAGPGQNITPERAARIAALDKNVNIKVGVLLSCTLCPEVVAATQLIALRNPRVTAEMFDLCHFPEFKEKWNIQNVPTILINDEVLKFGKLSIDALLDLIE